MFSKWLFGRGMAVPMLKNITLRNSGMHFFLKKYFASIENVRIFALAFKRESTIKKKYGIKNAAFV